MNYDVNNQRKLTTVVVSDIRMTFGSMVTFIVKWTLASIVATIILSAIVALVAAFIFAFIMVISLLFGVALM